MRARTMTALLAAAVLTSGGGGAAGESGTVVLDTTGFWRVHYTMRKPLIGTGVSARPAALGFETPAPPAEWTKPEFDDKAWRRIAGPPFPPRSNWSRITKENVGWVYADKCSAALALLCMRGKFEVKNPAAAQLTVSVAYRGGIVLYVNGKEIGRKHLQGGAQGLFALADDYPDDAFFDAGGGPLVANRGEKDEEKVRRWRLRKRRIENVPVPSSALRRGVNVLGIEIHRSSYSAKMPPAVDKLRSHEKMSRLWSTCGLENVRMVSSGSGAVPNVTRPAGFQAWNSDGIAPDYTLDWGDRNEKLRPVRIVGARNGSFSGKVVIGSTAPLKGLKASMSDLRAGGAAIPSSAVRVRYATPSGSEAYADVHYELTPGFFQALSDEAPDEVPVRSATKGIMLRPWVLPGTPKPVFGAVQPVWVTVKVPADAKPGLYEGILTVSSSGNRAVEAPVQLAVAGYRLPDADDFHTWVDLVQSPESVAMKYGVAVWSDRHFELLAESLKIAGELGDKSIYINLIAESNQGNVQTMVRWVKDGAGWRHDFKPLDRYLDLVAKHMGNPELACIYIWDSNLAGGHRDKVSQGAQPKVSVLDPATGKVETAELPRYTTGEGAALWRPVLHGVRDRLRKRGWEKAMAFGNVPDSAPASEVVKELGGLLSGVGWMRHAHSIRRDCRGAPLAYQALVWTPRYPQLPDCKPGKGWKRTDLVTQFIRSRDMFPLVHFRLMAEMNIAGNQRGVGRIGLDFWYVLKDKRGRLRGTIQARYPATGWRNLDWMLRSFTVAGPDGALSTCRTEMMREGLQECEARVLIERALDSGKLGGDLKKRCEEFMQERTWMLRTALDNHFLDGFARDAGHSWWSTPGQLGYHWYMSGVWQESSAKLYGLASEVAAATGAIPRSDAKAVDFKSGAGGTVPATRTGPAPAEARRPAASPARRSPAADDNEKARRLWSVADNFLKNRMEALARRKLEEIVKRYPETEYAERAREKLGKLE